MKFIDVPLPSDFFVRSAYMRLYRADKECDAWWPKTAFGEEIDTLLSRQHAEIFAAGYRITATGKVHWERCIKVWGVIGQDDDSRAASALRILHDDQWHADEDMPIEANMGLHTWARFVRPNLTRWKCIERARVGGVMSVRLTTDGREILNLISEQAS